jgi:hypothetical protein
VIYVLYSIFSTAPPGGGGGEIISSTINVNNHVAEVANAADYDLVINGAYSAASNQGPGIQPTPNQKSYQDKATVAPTPGLKAVTDVVPARMHMPIAMPTSPVSSKERRPICR